jgi:hypothetical protein
LEQNQNIQSSSEAQPPTSATTSPEVKTGEIVVPPLSAKDAVDDTKSATETTPTMEVHHHGHVHHKDKWKEYIFQFFMLFLAVFCGFLAEYQLEHKIEKERAKEFAASLITDLEKDISSIQKQILFREDLYKNADSLMILLKACAFDKSVDQSVRNFQGFQHFNRLRASKGTIDQLKASGSLRYFKNKQLTTSIINYYNELNEVDTRTQFVFDYLSAKVIPFTIAHFDSRYSDTAFQVRMNVRPFRNMGEEEQIQLYNMISSLYNWDNQLAVTVLPSALQEAKELISLIKKEYNWEEKIE